MAVDIVAVCSASQEHQSAQTIAIVLSVLFSLYTITAITLSALTIYSTSAQPTTAPSASAVETTASDKGMVDMSLVGLR